MSDEKKTKETPARRTPGGVVAEVMKNAEEKAAAKSGQASVSTENIETDTAKENKTPEKAIEPAPSETAETDAITHAALNARAEQAETEQLNFDDPDDAAVPSQITFMSQFSSLTCYFHAGAKAPNGAGGFIEVETRVDFVNGVYRTSNQRLITAMRKDKSFGRLFREETQTDRIAIRALAAQQRERMRAGVTSGTTASNDGDAAKFNAQDAALKQAENGLF